MNERIISDFHTKTKKKIYGSNPETDFNKIIIAVNNMYGWLYKTGILRKESFVFKDYENEIYFALDIKRLRKYKKSMVESNIPGAELAVKCIFDSEHNPCLYSGAIQLAAPMITYRSNNGCVSKSWECDIVRYLSNEAANEILHCKKRKRD